MEKLSLSLSKLFSASLSESLGHLCHLSSFLRFISPFWPNPFVLLFSRNYECVEQCGPLQDAKHWLLRALLCLQLTTSCLTTQGTADRCPSSRGLC